MARLADGRVVLHSPRQKLLVAFSPKAWQDFVDGAKAGDFDDILDELEAE